MPASGNWRPPIRDCVQNQTATAIPVTTTRNRRPRPTPVVGPILEVCRSRGVQGVSGTTYRLHGQLARFPQVQLAGAEIGQLLDAQELIGPRPPKRRQITFREFPETLLQRLVG